MSIANFPAQLQPIIQEGFLERAFEKPLKARLGYRGIADREVFPNAIGETLTKTRHGLKPAITTPLNPASNTNFDNGLTSSSYSVEQYTLTIDQYGDTIDLNTVTSGVGIANQAVVNASVNGEQAARSLDTLAQRALFSGSVGTIGGYLGGNTRVTAALSAAGNAVAVDDIRGFQYVFSSIGQQVPVSSSNPMTVTVADGDYELVGAVADSVNTSTAPNGISGTLTFTTNVSTADGALAQPVVSATAPSVVRPNARNSTAALQAPSGVYGQSGYVPGDTLTMAACLAALATLRMNNVPTINGLYHCYADDSQILGLFRDNDFKLLYRGAYNSEEYRQGQVFELVGILFIPTNLAPQQKSLGAGKIHRAFICGQGTLVEGNFSGMRQAILDSAGVSAVGGHIVESDSVIHVMRAPLDRLQQIIAQSWYWIGGYALPTDTMANPTVIPTATNSYLKRGVVIESLGAI